MLYVKNNVELFNFTRDTYMSSLFVNISEKAITQEEESHKVKFRII